MEAVKTVYPDIFFTEQYSELFKDTAFGGKPCHFNFAGIDYRFYKRPIPGTPYFDIVSPYGYSGPLELEEFADWDKYIPEFSRYCEREHIIAEFARLNPFIMSWGTHYEHEIYYIDLTQPETQIWKGFDKGCRSSLKGAGRNNLALRQETNLLDFVNLYQQTMKRDNAKPSYYFNEPFWVKLWRLGYFISVVDEQGVIKSSGCFLVYGDYCHYFLSASTGDSVGATNLLLWEAIKWAKFQDCKIFNLGGGLKTGDSLESFKRSFSHLSKPFYTYRHIHDKKVYDELSKGIETDFFPAYRAERKS